MEMKYFLKATVLFLAVFVFLVSLAPSAAYAQTLQLPKDIAVVDNTGKLVGSNISAGPGSAMAVFQVTHPSLADPVLVTLQVGQDRFFGSGQIGFMSDNCTGQPFFVVGPFAPFGFIGTGFFAQVFGPGQTTNFTFAPGQAVYIPDPNQPIQTGVTLGSFFTFGPGPAQPCTPAFTPAPGTPAQTSDVRPVLELITLVGGTPPGPFTPPFSLRAAFELLLP
ncbi:MAG: hypothetical protein HY726_16095 [Candidatus Rokubacteria bacterium]|nr:hypothetical protein [Candidatus Rokubacteria bacterium]